jgi:hypothetical protein
VVALSRVVVHHVEDDLETCGMQGFHHRFELRDLAAAVTGRAVFAVRGEESDGVVAPIVAEVFFDQVAVLDELLHGHYSHGGHAQVGEVFDRGRMCEPRVGSSDLLRDVWVQLGKSLHVQFVDDRLRERRSRRRVTAVGGPIERVIGDHALRNERRRIRLIHHIHVVHVVTEHRLSPLVLALDRSRVRIEQELVRVVSEAFGGIPRTVNSQAVPRADTRFLDESVEDVSRAVLERNTRFGAVVVE